MTPQEHYERGLELLASADEQFGLAMIMNPGSAQLTATLAQAHLTAAQIGFALESPLKVGEVSPDGGPAAP